MRIAVVNGANLNALGDRDPALYGGLSYDELETRIYDWARELDLSVRFAKIGTFLDQVVDVFYVTDTAGRKIIDEKRLHHIRERLLEAVDQPQATPAGTT